MVAVVHSTWYIVHSSYHMVLRVLCVVCGCSVCVCGVVFRVCCVPCDIQRPAEERQQIHEAQKDHENSPALVQNDDAEGHPDGGADMRTDGQAGRRTGGQADGRADGLAGGLFEGTRGQTQRQRRTRGARMVSRRTDTETTRGACKRTMFRGRLCGSCADIPNICSHLAPAYRGARLVTG